MFRVDRVNLVVGVNNVKKVLGERELYSLTRPSKEKIWAIWDVFKAAVGCGKTGAVRKASFGSRSITLLNTKLNRGSVIDFINSVVQKHNSAFAATPLKKLEKGNFLFGGASDEEIEKSFDEICVKTNKDKSLLENLGEDDEYSYLFAGDCLPLYRGVSP